MKEKELNMDEEQYRKLLREVNVEIYKFAKHQGIDLKDEKKLIDSCNAMKKIDLGNEVTEFLLNGIMHYDVGDQCVLKFINLEGISFDGRNVRRVDFRGTNANIDPQTVKGKNIEGANFEGIDMSDKCFDGCVISYTNLSYTNAKINPQTAYCTDLSGTKCDGLDLSHADFTDVCVEGASFKNAKINLDPQTVLFKNLTGTNLENVDMSGKNFDGCKLCNCNLTNTNAVLQLDCLDIDELWGCYLQGTTLLVGEDFNREQLDNQGVILGKISLDEYTVTKQRILSLFEDFDKQ